MTDDEKLIEEAHTPTDDEVDAMAYLITSHRFRERGLSGAIDESDVAVARPLAAFLHREGFRRTEVPEPSNCRHGFDAVTCPLPEADDYERRRLREAADRMDPLADKPYTSLDLALVRDAAYRASRAAPQGEPSDAQVEAAMTALWVDSDGLRGGSTETRDFWLRRMRAALRAAGGVR